MRIFLTLLFLAVAYHFTDSFCQQQTDGFSLARIHSDLNFEKKWETPPISEALQSELENALSQKFHYIGCGGQCFVFGSEDDRYVIKFFKHKIRKPLSLMKNIPFPSIADQWRTRKFNKIYAKLNRDFTSYKIAMEDLQEETGLIYIHLNKTEELNRTVTIVDKLGIAHQVSLDGIEFVVQKKAELVDSRFDALAKAEDEAQIKRAMHQLLEVIVARCQKGIFDEDAKIHRNFGFLEGKAVVIDVGRFVRDLKRKDPSVYKEDVANIAKRFRKWLMQTHPECIHLLDEELYEFQAVS